MTPSFPTNYSCYLVWLHSKHFCKNLIFERRFTNEMYIGLLESCCGTSLSIRRICSFFFNHVNRIIAWSSKPQVTGINARRVIAMMADKKSNLFAIVGYSIGNYMRSTVHSIQKECAITVLRDASSENPALSKFWETLWNRTVLINLCEKTSYVLRCYIDIARVNSYGWFRFVHNNTVTEFSGLGSVILPRPCLIFSQFQQGVN